MSLLSRVWLHQDDTPFRTMPFTFVSFSEPAKLSCDRTQEQNRKGEEVTHQRFKEAHDGAVLCLGVLRNPQLLRVPGDGATHSGDFLSSLSLAVS